VRGDTDIAVALDGGFAGHGLLQKTGAASGLVETRGGLKTVSLEAEVRERLVGFSHTVRIIFLLY
jgi:hypothetical protein